MKAQNPRPSILVADDDAAIRTVLRTLLVKAGYSVSEAANGAEAIEALNEREFDLVVTDLVMPRGGGVEVLRKTRECQPLTPVVVLTAAGSIRDCAEVMRLGAFNFLAKPFHPTELEEVVRQAVHAREPRRNLPSPRATDTHAQVALVGVSAAMRGVIDVVERIAASPSTVLVTGESGTGKEVIARLLHGSSPRAGRRFIAVNCGAIPDTLMESELFGHVKGAFTGASEECVGKFVQADGGTLFLDEIAELPLPLQVKLLRVLQDREVTPVGGSRSRCVDVRIIAATNQKLPELVSQGRFRSDLFYRLDVLPIEIPALRDRAEDIVPLAHHFLASMNRRFGRRVELGDDALTVLTLYSWPGNVREMENLFERLVVLDRAGRISSEDLPPRFRASGTPKGVHAAAAQLAQGSIDLPATLAAVEASLIDQALRQADGNRTRAAELLSLSRTTLLDKMRRHETPEPALRLVGNE